MNEERSRSIYTRLSAVDITTLAGVVPLLSNLFFVRHRSDRKAWCSFGQLAGGPPDRTMSSLPAGWL